MVLVLLALCTLLSLSLLPGVQTAVTLEHFYPFGTDTADSQTITQDDGGSGLLEISVAFPFFGDRHTGLYVNNNGVVSFLREVSQFTPVAFPIAGDRRVVAPFWADVDNRRAGRVFFRESQEPSVLGRASGEVRTYFSEFPNFNATWVLISTWHDVTFFGGNSHTPINTFQAVLITDGELSFTVFQYSNITWTTGMHASSGGNAAGLGGIAAQAGFNAGDGKRYFNIPGSRTTEVVNIEETTNVGYPGRWVFRIDHANVEVGGCNDSASVCPHLRPCLNGGQCIDDCITGNPSFTCSCLAGFSGRRCQIDINECESQPCLNGAQCTDQVNGFTCTCPSAFTGTFCDTGEPSQLYCVSFFFSPSDSCEDDNCENHQICEHSASGSQNCTCAPGFHGHKCEEECLCQNGGQCVDANGTCECPSGYTGLYCQFEVTETPCSHSRPCPDGGPCLEYGGSYLCTCHTGAELDHKDFYPYVQPESACDSSPCLNGGYCYERDGGYTCECKYGYWGNHCEKVRLNTCASGPCRNGGSCKEESGSYRCVCPYRFTGKHCEVGKPDPCASSPCVNGGTCFHYIGKYKCECTEAYLGRHCEGRAHPSLGCGPPPQLQHADVHFSSTTPGSIALYVCHVGFTSVPRATQSICGIQGDWSQPPVCEEVNECLSQPCLHGGTCRNKIGSYQCVCSVGFTGNQCQTEQDGCESNPCLNGGLCRGYRRNFVCVCKNGFFGDQCQMLEDPCVLKPCGNRGRCWSDRRGNYNCVCKTGLTGKDCEKDLLPPPGLHVVRVEEGEVELRWDQLDVSQSPISMFAVSYAPLGHSDPQTDYLDRHQSTHVMRGLLPGLLYNISTTSIKLKTNSNDSSQPATALIRTRPLPVQQLQVDHVTSSEVRLHWLLQAPPPSQVSRVLLSVQSADGSPALTALLNGTMTEYTLSSLLPGHMYTVDVMVQSGIRADEFPSTSHSAGPLHIWTRPLPPQNLTVSHLKSTVALITWSRQLAHTPDGFVVNLTRGLNTRSRFLPDGTLGSYTLRELAPGQAYSVALTSVRNNGQDQIHSTPQYLTFTTCECFSHRHGKPERIVVSLYYRFTQLVDRRGKITAKLAHLPRKSIRHRTKPDPPIRLEKMEETTNKISLALELQEESMRAKSESLQDCLSLHCLNGGSCVNESQSLVCDCAAGFKGRQCELSCQRVPHPCTRLYSETKSVPVWEDGVCHYLALREAVNNAKKCDNKTSLSLFC
uniref:Sushi, nidogen and EGF-like domain-containing protein 1 n=1 Tax=Gouania willdenowi TaxID=441366 RepID=A0A8C5N809_GOUWI